MPRVSEQDSSNSPKVSVAMITYNHGKYIAQSVESVLMQETDFPVELIIGEDCSTDNTRQIVQGYAEKYPNVIRAFLPDRNLGMHENLAVVMGNCRGQYIACLEGDDYWNDPHKLQKQVSLMDKNPQYSMCGTAARDVTMEPDGNEKETGTCPSGKTKKLYDLEDVLSYYPFRTLTFMLRNDLVIFPDWFKQTTCGDNCLLVLFAEKGPVAFINEVTGTYRIHGGGIWSGSSMLDRWKANRENLDILGRYFSGKYSKLLRDRDFVFSKDICLNAAMNSRNQEARLVYWQSFWRFAPYRPFAYLTLGLLAYRIMWVTQWKRAWNRLTMRIAIRTHVRKILKSVE